MADDADDKTASIQRARRAEIMTERSLPQILLSQPRVEYRAVQQEVAEKQAAGYSKIIIFEELTNSGWRTISYSALCNYIRGE
jgi:hypothetical protein